MPCKYCGEKDESKLLMSSRLINGEVVHIDLCLRCFWIDRFKAQREDDKGILPEREVFEGIESARSVNTLGLQE